MIIYCWCEAHKSLSNSVGKPMFSFYSYMFATIIHYFLADYLAFNQDLKMHGLGIATCIHFICRFLFMIF